MHMTIIRLYPLYPYHLCATNIRAYSQISTTARASATTTLTTTSTTNQRLRNYENCGRYRKMRTSLLFPDSKIVIKDTVEC